MRSAQGCARNQDWLMPAAPLSAVSISESAIGILFPDKPELRSNGDEVDIETLVSPTILTQAVASKVFKVDAPALFVRRVGCKVMLGAGRPLANSGDVLPDFGGQAVYVIGIPGIIFACAAGFRGGRKFTAEQKANDQQQGPDGHANLPAWFQQLDSITLPCLVRTTSACDQQGAPSLDSDPSGFANLGRQPGRDILPGAENPLGTNRVDRTGCYSFGSALNQLPCKSLGLFFTRKGFRPSPVMTNSIFNVSLIGHKPGVFHRQTPRSVCRNLPTSA